MYLMQETIGKGCSTAVSKLFRGMKSQKTAKKQPCCDEGVQMSMRLFFSASSRVLFDNTFGG